MRNGQAASTDLPIPQKTAVTRAVALVAAGQNDGRPVRDTLLLDHRERRDPAGIFTGLRGTAVEMRLSKGQRLGQDDCLVLDDGSLVEIVARPEPLIEVRATDPEVLARTAWLLGDHHIPVEIRERRLRLLRTDASLALLQTTGVKLADIEAPFEPEGGAYGVASYPKHL